MERSIDQLTADVRGSHENADVSDVVAALVAINDRLGDSEAAIMSWVLELLNEEDGGQAVNIIKLLNAAHLSVL